MPILQITKDGFLLQEIEIQAEAMAIGRDPENDIRLADLTVSRRHGWLKRQADGRYVIENLQSRNGISINGRAIAQSAVLTDGDQLRIGVYQLTFRDTAEMTQRRPDHLDLSSGKKAPEMLPAASHPTPVQPLEERDAAGAAAKPGHPILENAILVNADSNAIFALHHDQIVLGNDGQVDIRVPGPERIRATILRRGEYFYICSETPAPCVAVNGRPVMNAQLAYNDQIEIGGRRFIFREI